MSQLEWKKQNSHISENSNFLIDVYNFKTEKGKVEILYTLSTIETQFVGSLDECKEQAEKIYLRQQKQRPRNFKRVIQ